MRLDGFNLPPLPSGYGAHAAEGEEPVDSPRSLHARYVLRRYLAALPEPITLPEVPQRRTKSPVKIGIIGAGVAGLYAAMIIDSLGDPSLSYEILEASDRVGGRLYTHQFSTGLPNDYYDVGAMRFPEIPFMKRTFDLFRRLSITPIPYVMSRDNNINLFNRVSLTNKQVEDANKQGNHDPFNTRVPGLTNSTDALISAQIGKLKSDLKSDFHAGWGELMKLDTWSTRGYMANKGTDGVTYSPDLVTYLETFDTGTGLYDQAFTETVLDSLTFDFAEGVKWYCIQGGMEQVAQQMFTSKIKGPVHLNKRVTAIGLNGRPGPESSIYKVDVTVPGDSTRTYDHVISTVPFGCLRTIDTSQCHFGWELSTAIRALHYDDSTKVGICFSRRWWEDPKLNQRGGVSSTDRPTRIVVYPSYGIGKDGAGASIIVSYTWSQDASRLGALAQGTQTTPECHLIDLILGDLAAMHGMEKEVLKGLVVDYHAFNFYHNENSVGAFALFGPGQFANLYQQVTKPHAGVLHFAGEATSVHHAWVVGALNSAYRSVLEILQNIGDYSLIEKMQREWGPNDEFEPKVLDLQGRLGRVALNVQA